MMRSPMRSCSSGFCGKLCAEANVDMLMADFQSSGAGARCSKRLLLPPSPECKEADPRNPLGQRTRGQHHNVTQTTTHSRSTTPGPVTAL